jgi:predicted DsbA family dithiol-disulfide isomerase
VPAFIINGNYKIVGAQPLEVFRDTLKNLGWINLLANTECKIQEPQKNEFLISCR